MVAYYTLKDIDTTSTATATDYSNEWFIVSGTADTTSTTVSFSETEYVYIHAAPEESIDRIARIKYEIKVMNAWNNQQLFHKALQHQPKTLKGHYKPTTYKCRNILKYNINYGRKGRK